MIALCGGHAGIKLGKAGFRIFNQVAAVADMLVGLILTFAYVEAITAFENGTAHDSRRFNRGRLAKSAPEYQKRVLFVVLNIESVRARKTHGLVSLLCSKPVQYRPSQIPELDVFLRKTLFKGKREDGRQPYPPTLSFQLIGLLTAGDRTRPLGEVLV